LPSASRSAQGPHRTGDREHGKHASGDQQQPHSNACRQRRSLDRSGFGDGSCASLFAAALRIVRDLVGDRLDFRVDRRGNFLADSGDFLNQLGQLRRRFGAMIGILRLDREFLLAHDLDLFLAATEVFDKNLQPRNSLAVLGGLRQLCHLAGKLERGSRPGSKVVVGLLEFVGSRGHQNVADAHLHAAHRGLCLGGALRNRLLSRGVVIGLANLGTTRHLQIDHRRDHQDRQRRRDRELGSDPQILDNPQHGNVLKCISGSALEATAAVPIVSDNRS
jgi:hypothetical protein